jgi:glycerate 2-kinase
MNARRILLELFDAALRAVEGRACVVKFFQDTKPAQSVEVFAVGKAASAMTLGAFDALGSRIANALVVTKDGHLDPELVRSPRVTALECAHPVPDERSLAAGDEWRQRLLGLETDSLPLFLISGGASSLVEWLQPGTSLDGLRELNQRGLSAGWDIARLNEERGRLSLLKAGGVARLLAGRQALALFISDVPGDDPDIIGSGLLGHDAGRVDHVARHVIANVECAVRAAAESADTFGLRLGTGAARIEGEAALVADRVLAELRACESDGIVWGGESTVTLPARHGRGGRNTHLALAVARQLRATDRWLMLAAGTDGTDGPTVDAGAIVDSGTIERATLGGCDVERAWIEFDSGTALEAAGDLVHTGPTGTNVGDILIALKHSATSLRGQPAPRML